jgi:hypothetical protein
MAWANGYAVAASWAAGTVDACAGAGSLQCGSGTPPSSNPARATRVDARVSGMDGRGMADTMVAGREDAVPDVGRSPSRAARRLAFGGLSGIVRLFRRCGATVAPRPRLRDEFQFFRVSGA